LSNRNFTTQEATVFIPGAPPVHQGGSAQTLAAGFQGAQAGLSMAQSISQINWPSGGGNVDAGDGWNPIPVKGQ
jgi:hypothetical protein